jgi:tetratricopeptide (TPR) repeat protein
VAATSIKIENYEEAERYLKLAESDAPPPRLYLLRGKLELARSRTEAARQHFQTALERDPQSLEAALGLADAARLRLDFDTAELLYRQILGREPRHLAALSGVAEVLRSRQRWNTAADWQRRYLEAKPAPVAEDYARLGEILYRAGKYAEAEPALRRAIQMEPYSYLARRYLGELCADLSRWDEAGEHLGFVERYFPDTDARTYTLLARVQTQLGDARAATRTMRKAQRIFPNHSELKRILGGN